jgi:hypothetical protein
LFISDSGAYRALVTQAGAMSKPILERLGFRGVCEITILLDDPDTG